MGPVKKPRHIEIAEAAERAAGIRADDDPNPTVFVERPRFVIYADRERYPGADSRPDRIVIEGGNLDGARAILKAIDLILVQGSGCDNLYLFEGDDDD